MHLYAGGRNSNHRIAMEDEQAAMGVPIAYITVGGGVLGVSIAFMFSTLVRVQPWSVSGTVIGGVVLTVFVRHGLTTLNARDALREVVSQCWMK